MKLSLIVVLATAFVPVAATGAEYYIYKDVAGGIVLSNVPATERPADRSPESITLMRSYTWAEATPEQIAATEKENREAARISVLRDIAMQAERLADEVQRSNEITLAALRQQTRRPATEINQVIVTTAGIRDPRFRRRW
jgi:hypothetical protein